MTLSNDQLLQLKSNYAEKIIDAMDMDDLLMMVHDLLMDSYMECTEEQMQEEVEDLYSEDMWEDLVEGVTN
jgi:hypothetical protein